MKEKIKSVLVVSHDQSIDVITSLNKLSKNKMQLGAHLNKIFPTSKNPLKEKYLLIEDPYSVFKLAKLIKKDRSAEVLSQISEIVDFVNKNLPENVKSQ